MTTSSNEQHATIIPGLRYRDALAMMDWLTQAFGFVRHALYLNGDKRVAHAQMTFGNGMIMLGSVDNGSPSAALLKQPDEIGRFETQSPYLIVKDCRSLYERAKKAGAEIIMELEEKDYGGSGFTCRDPEGHLWNFGSYDPWQTPEAE